MQQMEVAGPGHGAASLFLLHAASKDPASLLRALPSPVAALSTASLYPQLVGESHSPASPRWERGRNS